MRKRLRWTRRAAEQGDVTGQFNMGTIYAGGLGVERDYAEAAEWFARAAEQDDAASRFNLGVLYARGLGVPRDDEEAMFLLSTATIIAGDPEANLLEIGAAAENYAYVVMMTMEEPALTRALERTRAWEKEFLQRYLKPGVCGLSSPGATWTASPSSNPHARGRAHSGDALQPLRFRKVEQRADMAGEAHRPGLVRPLAERISSVADFDEQRRQPASLRRARARCSR